MLKVFNTNQKTHLISNGKLANTFWSRGKGLIGTKALRQGEGILIEPCKGVHCWFMSIPIDVIYLNRENQVVDVDENMKPWSMGRPRPKARKVVEVPAGMVQKTGTKIGDQLTLKIK